MTYKKYNSGVKEYVHFILKQLLQQAVLVNLSAKNRERLFFKILT